MHSYYAFEGDTIMSKNLAYYDDSAVLDQAHTGDIRGALGTVRANDFAVRKGWKARLLTLLAIMGPGLIVMVGDNDAGGVSTYAQAGQNYGMSLLWLLLFLIPVLIVNQEMVVRLGLVTGVGHARLIFERFGKFWGAFSVGDLFILNFLTIVTEFIGIKLSLQHLGVNPVIGVAAAAVLLIGSTVTGSFRRWEQFMYLLVALNFLVIPLAFMSHPHWGPVTHGLLVPGVKGGLTSNSVLLMIGIVGTTVAPWQLFFQQSNVIDKRLTPRWMNYERADTAIGSIVVVVGAAALMSVTAFAFQGTALAGHFVNAAVVMAGLSSHVGALAGNLFAIVLLNASIIGAAAVTLSTSYAFGDVFGTKHSLHRKWSDARGFYLVYGLIVAVSGGIVLIPQAPLGVITVAVQALAGILLPSATVFLLLLCNDRDVLGPWVNRPWLNAVSSVIVGVLVLLSLVLAVTTFFPAVDVRVLVFTMTAVLAGVLVSALAVSLARRAKRKVPGAVAASSAVRSLDERKQQVGDRYSWRMPPLSKLSKPVWSPVRKLGMLTLRLYLVLAVVMLVIKAVRLAMGHAA